MSDISNQFIKDSYNYVLQSDIFSGIVFRIGGSIPVNPIFLSGISFFQSLRYSDGSEQPGYVLTTDALGNATWGPVSGASSSGITSLNGLTAPIQTFIIGSGGTDFNIISSGSGHTYNLPDASIINRGVINTDLQYFSGIKLFNDGLSASTIAGNTIIGNVISGNTLYGNGENLVGVVKKFASDIGDGISNTITISHNLSTRDIQVEVYRNLSPWDTIFCDVVRPTINSVTLIFGGPPQINEYRLVVTA